jgi:hypothetical protein
MSIADAADRLVRACTETHNTKVAVFQAFRTAFEETAKQFTTQPERDLAQHLSAGFLSYWSEILTAPNLVSKPTYSSVAASSPLSSASPTPTLDPAIVNINNPVPPSPPTNKQSWAVPLSSWRT